MATDPVERIREYEHEPPIALDLDRVVKRLAKLPPSPEVPYLTVSLDWRPHGEEPERIPPPPPKRSQRRAFRRWREQGSPWREAKVIVREEFDALLERHGPRGRVFDSLKADVERIATYLDKELDPAARGIFIVACHERDVFEPVPLDVPLPTDVTTGPIPSLRPLVHAAEDYPPYAVLVAEQKETVLWLMERSTWERSVRLEASDYPRKQKQGGWSQRRYQNRADTRVNVFAKTIAQETRRALDERAEEIDYLVIAADEPMYGALVDRFHETVASRIVGRIHLEIEADVDRVADEAQPVVEQTERRHELEAVQNLRDLVAARGHGVAGPEHTLVALETGQALKLVMNDDFSRPGWADYALSLYGVGTVPDTHPAGGDVADLVSTAVEDEVIRLAIRLDAEIELVWTEVPITPAELHDIPDADEPDPRSAAALALDELGGVGAELRYVLDVGLPTPPL